MAYDIIIPSCRPYPQLRMAITAMREHDSEEHNYIPTGFKASAAVNRNIGIHEALKGDNEFIIMIDDDIGGFYPGWQDAITEPLKRFSSVRISSARLMTPDKELSPMMGVDQDLSKDLCEVPKFFTIKGYRFGAILSAAIAFRKKAIVESGICFDNNFVGSGFEDTLFCFHLSRHFDQCRFVCNNRCQLIHYHEMKSQNEHFKQNERYFLSRVQAEVEGVKNAA